jgi:hypothetical protein
MMACPVIVGTDHSALALLRIPPRMLTISPGGCSVVV